MALLSQWYLVLTKEKVGDNVSNPIEEITSIAHLLPIEVLEDVNKRIGDWLASGGIDNDPYIYQQLRFAKRFVKDGEQNEC